MYDVIIVGAGAAGMMAAGVAARAGRKVLLVEKMEKAGRKVRITGRGRCNVTNSKPREEFLEHVRANAEFFEPAFKGLSNQSMPLFFKRLGVKLTEERGDRLFPESGKAWDIADALADWAKDEGDVEVLFNTKVTEIIVTAGKVRGVRVTTRKGYPRNLEAGAVIVATGGVSYPSTGSTGDGYRFAHDTGHRVESVRPALVALESSDPVVSELKGANLRNVGVKLLIDNEVAQEEFGEMEFTQRGMDGAVMLRVSRRAVDALIDGREVAIDIDLKPALDEPMLLARIEREIEGMPVPEEATCGELMRKLLPKPFVEPFASRAGVILRDGVSRMTDAQKLSLVTALRSWRLPVVDYRPFEEAIITAGGVAVDDIDPLTLQSRLVQGLYFAGEVLDIDGDTGGYNLQIAFSTGYLAGQLR